METTATESPAEARPDSVEKGIYLTPHNKLVHSCKVRDDLGCGITRCGVRFLIGSKLYIADAEFGSPPQQSEGEPTFHKCQVCYAGKPVRAAAWRDWKYIVRRTLKMLGHIKD